MFTIKSTNIRSVTCIVSIVICLSSFAQTSEQTAQPSLKPETLEQRVARGEPAAFIEAANNGRKDLIPVIESFAEQGSPTEASRISTHTALAKLGVRKYLDEIVAELVETNSSAYIYDTQHYAREGTESSRHIARHRIQVKALERLSYINDPTTIKIVASCLYDTANPNAPEANGDFDSVIYFPLAESAVKALTKMVKNPPNTSDLEGMDKYRIWQQWWEQNKDKYP